MTSIKIILGRDSPPKPTDAMTYIGIALPEGEEDLRAAKSVYLLQGEKGRRLMIGKTDHTESADALLTPALAACGEFVFGPHWKAALARIAEVSRKTVDHWCKKSMPSPHLVGWLAYLRDARIPAIAPRLKVAEAAMRTGVEPADEEAARIIREVRNWEEGDEV